MRAKTVLGLSAGIGSLTALGTYILFNPRLRKDMMNAGSPTRAVQALGTHMKDDAIETREQAMTAVRRNRWLGRARHRAERKLARVERSAKSHVKAIKNEVKAAAQEMKEEAKSGAMMS